MNLSAKSINDLATRITDRLAAEDFARSSLYDNTVVFNTVRAALMETPSSLSGVYLNEENAIEILTGVLEETNDHPFVDEITSITLKGKTLSALVFWMVDEWGNRPSRKISKRLGKKDYAWVTALVNRNAVSDYEAT